MESVNLDSPRLNAYSKIPNGDDDFASVLDQVRREQAQTQPVLQDAAQRAEATSSGTGSPHAGSMLASVAAAGPSAGAYTTSPNASSTSSTVNPGDSGPTASLASPSMFGQGTLVAAAPAPAAGLMLGTTTKMGPAGLGSLSLGPAANLLAMAAPAVATPLALSGDTPADPNAMKSMAVVGRSDLSAYAGNGQVNVYTIAPVLGGLMSQVTGSTTMQVVPGAAPAAPSSLIDTHGNNAGLLQNGQITLTAGGLPALDGNTIPPPVNLGGMTGALSSSSGLTARTTTASEGTTVRLRNVPNPASLVGGGGFTPAAPMPSSPQPVIPPQVADQPEGFTPAQPTTSSTAGKTPTVNLGPLIFDPPDLQIPIALEARSNGKLQGSRPTSSVSGTASVSA
jgi:hypothetical protein